MFDTKAVEKIGTKVKQPIHVKVGRKQDSAVNYRAIGYWSRGCRATAVNSRQTCSLTSFLKARLRSTRER